MISHPFLSLLFPWHQAACAGAIRHVSRLRGLSMAGLFFLLLASSCTGPPREEVKTYLFLGHPYDWLDGYRIDPRLEALDFRCFDQVWLGGDVCSRTTERYETLRYLDSLFDFRSGRVHWALGNHDLLYGHPEWISWATGRPSFYYQAWLDGICLLVLNTNLFWFYPSPPPLEQCAEKEAQLALIRAVTDTLRSASHLLILHHHALLNEMKTGPAGDTLTPFNVNAMTVAMTCDSADQFTALVYPMLQKVRRRGIPVILVGGDLGMRAKTFDYRTPDGVVLLGSGINNSIDPRYVPEYVTTLAPDSILLFRHDVRRKTLEWSFEDLDAWTAQRAGISCPPQRRE